MTGAEKSFDLATGQCVVVRVARRVATATVLVPRHLEMIPTARVSCRADNVRVRGSAPERVYFGLAYIAGTAAEVTAIETFVNEARQ